nr:helix-turn-helix domain containing protein [Nocardioides convexus]
MLERGEPFSIRAVAREAGVSPTAPYRHFPEREALESALAAEGLRDLKADLVRDRALPTTTEEPGGARRRLRRLRPAPAGAVPADVRQRVQHRRRGTRPRCSRRARVCSRQPSPASSPTPTRSTSRWAAGGWCTASRSSTWTARLTASSIEEVAAQVRASLIAVFATRPRRLRPASPRSSDARRH